MLNWIIIIYFIFENRKIYTNEFDVQVAVHRDKFL